MTSSNPVNNFSFVNISGDPTTKNPQITKEVKSHVMRRVRGQTREARSRRREEMGKAISIPYFTAPPRYGTGDRSFKNVSSIMNVSRFENLGMESEDREFHNENHDSTSNSKSVDGSQEAINLRKSSPPGYLVGASKSRQEVFEECVVRQLEISTRLMRRQLLSPAAMDANLDPYNVLPVPVSSRVLMLLHSNLSTTIRTSVHADPTGKFFSYYIDDPARLFITVAFSAAVHQQRTGEKDRGEFPYFFSRSLVAIEKNLDDPGKRASDSMIATVSVFANMENLQGDHEKSLMHLNAVLRMVKLRSGLENLGWHGILRRMVLWSDLLYAARAQTAPRIPLQSIHPITSISSFLPPANTHVLSHNAALVTETLYYDRLEILDILQRLHELATFLNAMPIGPGKELPAEAAYPDRLYTVEHTITTALTKELQYARLGRGNHSIFHTVLHASLLFIYTNLRQTPVGGAIRNALVNRLQNHLEQLDKDDMADRFPAVMLWVFHLGLVTAAWTPSGLFWTGFLRRVCLERRLESWRDVEKEMEGLPIFENVYRGMCEMAWNERVYVNMIGDL